MGSGGALHRLPRGQSGRSSVPRRTSRKVLEGAEYTHGYFSDDGTGYSVAKYGKIIALTWEALVNDNLGAFLRVQPALGQAARRLEADSSTPCSP